MHHLSSGQQAQVLLLVIAQAQMVARVLVINQ